MIGSILCRSAFISTVGMLLLIGFAPVLSISLLVYLNLYPIQHMASNHTLKPLRSQGHWGYFIFVFVGHLVMYNYLQLPNH